MTDNFEQKLADLEASTLELVVKYNQTLADNKALQTSCQRLEEENTLLQSKNDRWLKERARLSQCNELATTKLQTVLARLKSIERFT